MANKKSEEYIGVDLDGTAAMWSGWVKWNSIGKPIPLMMERIRGWLSEGKIVKVITARVGLPYQNDPPLMSVRKRHVCKTTGERYSDYDMVCAIKDYFKEHVGATLDVQCYKDYNMIELWDDRAVQLIPNTGRTLIEEHQAELSALKGKAQGPTED